MNMKKIALIKGICFLTLASVAQEPLELITYNIRMNTSGDGEHAWPYRKNDVAALFRFHRADMASTTASSACITIRG